MQLTISVVTYKNDISMLNRLFSSIFTTDLAIRVFVIDNSPEDTIRALCSDPRISYVFNKKNVGFGAGHNIAIKEALGRAPYHLIVNPDIYFENGVLDHLFLFMEQHHDIGLLMPKILSSDGSVQYLCRLLPSPWDLLIRRFNLLGLRQKIDYAHALRFTGYTGIFDVPYLSGCFMFLRSNVFNDVGMFDERFFMYMEDVDFSRRINARYRTVFYGDVVVFHEHSQGSYTNVKLCLSHISSMIQYYHKWGWMFDFDRRIVNRKTLQNLRFGKQ